MALRYYDSKTFLVQSVNDNHDLFCIWKDGMNYFSFEFLGDNYPASTVCVWRNLEQLATEINWTEWMKKGIKNEALRKLVCPEPKITHCRITPLPKDILDPMPKVYVRYDTEEEHLLFEFYPDEISFSENEFIGLTESEARALKFKKDKQFLQS